MNDGFLVSACVWAATSQTQPEAGGTNVVGMPSSAPGGPATPANGATPATGAPPAGGAAQQSPFGLMLPMILVMAVVLILPMLAGRKEKKKRAEMMATLKRGDKVVTTGGIIGTIIDVDDEVVLRLEEGRLRITRSAIHQVLTATRVKSDALLAEPKSEPAGAVKV